MPPCTFCSQPARCRLFGEWMCWACMVKLFGRGERPLGSGPACQSKRTVRLAEPNATNRNHLEPVRSVRI